MLIVWNVHKLRQVWIRGPENEHDCLKKVTVFHEMNAITSHCFVVDQNIEFCISTDDAERDLC